METHGENPEKKVVAIIPARHSSVRLPGKLLLDVVGKPLILHTLDRALLAEKIDRVIVAVDHAELLAAVKDAGGEAVMTSRDHRSGSDRVAEVAKELGAGSIVVNLQGDEPLIPPGVIDRAVELIEADPAADIVTTSEPFEDAESVLNPDAVKVVTGRDGRALYFSRSPIPFPREAVRRHGDLRQALYREPALLSRFRKHTGLYVFRREALLDFTSLEPGKHEDTEKLEQLRALEHGLTIRVLEVEERSIGVDTEQDLMMVRRMMAASESEAAV